MRRIGLTLVAMAALVGGSTGVASVASAAPSGSADSPAEAVSPTSGPAAAVSGMSRSAKKRKLKKCRKLNRKSRRKACAKRVRKRYARSNRPAPSGDTVTVDVRDKYFSPDVVNIKTNDSILWVWNPVNHDAHNVNLVKGPPGVKRIDYATPSSPSINYQFKRRFPVAGTYRFACSIHYLMTMTVEVSK